MRISITITTIIVSFWLKLITHHERPIGQPSLATSNSTSLTHMYHQYRESMNIFWRKSEVKCYFTKDAEAPSDTFYILILWKVHSTKFLVLFWVVRNVLAILIIMVAVELVFSTGCRVLYAYQSSFDLSTVETLICTQNYLRSTQLD